MSSKTFRNNPNRAGIEWAGDIGEDIYDRLETYDLVEFIPENFLRKHLQQYRDRFFAKLKELNTPVIVHYTQLSMLSVEDFKSDHFNKIFEMCADLPLLSVSDHLCMTEMNGITTGQLTPSFYNDETLEAVCRKIETIQSAIGKEVPFALENIAVPYFIPNQQYTETQFIKLFQQATGAKLLIDLNNLYANGLNFGINPYQWIDEVDYDQIDSVHLAGGFFDDDQFMQDGHCERVPEQVWDMFRYLIKKAGRALPTIVERTGKNEGGMKPIDDDIAKAQDIMDELTTLPEQPTGFQYVASQGGLL